MEEKELSKRKQRILQVLIEDYISTAEPVSSGNIREKYMSDISSATIRSELASLEDMGYLVQPHISAGRIPSARAYKLYVNTLMSKGKLNKNEIDSIRSHFDTKLNQMDDIIKQTAKIISDVTNYTSVIVLSDISAVKIREIKLVDLYNNQALVIIITDSGILKDKTISLENNLKSGYLEAANKLINKVFVGKRVEEILNRKQISSELEKELEEFKDLFLKLVEVLSSYNTNKENKVYLDGALKTLDYPEYNDIDNAKGFLSVISEKEKLYSLINNDDDIEFSVKIGGDDGIDNCAIVTASYKINGKEIGKAGVIGPERMDYSKVMSVLNYLGGAMSELIDTKLIEEDSESKNK